MGQYYKPVFLNEDKTEVKAYAYSHDFNNGLKLMEHSWMKNDFVRFIENALILEPQYLVWAGDYADPEMDLPDEILAKFVNEDVTLKELKEEGVTLYHMTNNATKITHNEEVKKFDYSHDFKCIAPLNYKYLINYDKKQFVDKSKTPKSNDGWQIHPLPLLTCEGNGRGGGDFHGESSLIGAWSRDKIGVVSKKSDIPKGFKEIIFDLAENF